MHHFRERNSEYNQRGMLGRFTAQLFRSCLLVFGFACLQGCSPKQGNLNGSVFIVTKGAENIKLGLVTVLVLDEPQARAHIAMSDLIIAGKLRVVESGLEQLIKQHTKTIQSITITSTNCETAKLAAAKAAENGELRLQTLYKTGPSGEWLEQLGAYKPDQEYAEEIRRAHDEFRQSNSSIIFFAKENEAKLRDQLARLGRMKPEFTRRQKLFDEWMPIWQKHFQESQDLSVKINDLTIELRRLESEIETQKSVLRNWPALIAGDYLDNLPTLVASAKTDADGKFSIPLPRKGRFAIAAKAQRSVGGNAEKYSWFVWASLNGARTKEVMLSNDNLLPENSPDSAVQIVIPSTQL